jgi:hypothetical protein
MSSAINPGLQEHVFPRLRQRRPQPAGRSDRRAVAGALAAAVIGYVLQPVFADTEIDPAAYCAGLALLN